MEKITWQDVKELAVLTVQNWANFITQPKTFSIQDILRDQVPGKYLITITQGKIWMRKQSVSPCTRSMEKYSTWAFVYKNKKGVCTLIQGKGTK